MTLDQGRFRSLAPASNRLKRDWKHGTVAGSSACLSCERIRSALSPSVIACRCQPRRLRPSRVGVSPLTIWSIGRTCTRANGVPPRFRDPMGHLAGLGA
jgi:hypothetical protein